MRFAAYRQEGTDGTAAALMTAGRAMLAGPESIPAPSGDVVEVTVDGIGTLRNPVAGQA